MTVGNEELKLSLRPRAVSLARQLTKQASEHEEVAADARTAQAWARSAMARRLRADAEERADLDLLRQAAAKQRDRRLG